jgi:hypothetical protein
LDRTSDTSGENALHTEQDCLLEHGFPDAESAAGCLTIYARAQPGAETLLGALFGALSLTGFGADTSIGLGQFAPDADMEPADWLDEPMPNANAMTSLSTFQPAEDDPVEGCWELLTKFGKLCPDLGLENVFKRPLILLRPGACFISPPRPFLGHALPYGRLLDDRCCDELEAMNVQPIHAAFGLTVPYFCEPPT